MKAWAIKKWSETFEHAATRKLKRLGYVGFPTDQGSLRFRELLQTMLGAAAFGHFSAIVEYAASPLVPCRGLFVRSGQALTMDQIAAGASIPIPMLRRTWQTLTDPSVGWLYQATLDPQNLPTTYCFVDPNPPWIRQSSATAPPPMIEKSAGTPLALKTPTHPPKTTHPPKAPKGGGGGPSLAPDQEAAYAALIADPWPGLSLAKARALASKHPPASITAAIRRGKAANDAGSNVGGGLVALWIETGDSADRGTERNRIARRRRCREWLERHAKPREIETALAMFRQTYPGVAEEEQAILTSGEFADFVADAFERVKVLT